MNIATLLFSQRLTKQILMKVLFFGVLGVTIATVMCYFIVYNQSKERTIASLHQYMIEREQVENQVFADAYNNLSTFKDEFLNLYLSDLDFSNEDFWKMYFVDADGATRMKKKYFDGFFTPELGRSWGVTSFIGNNQSVDSHDFKKRLLIAYILVNRYGPAWASTGVLHATYPENAITTFYPDAPWGLQAKPDLPMNELGTIKAALQSTNPDRTPVWTGLYYDETVDQWTITLEIPTDYKGKHLVNPSLDVHLSSIMHRLESDSLAGTYPFILSKKGYLVAHPGELKNELKRKGQLSLAKINDPDLDRMYGLISRAEPDANGISVIEDPQGDNYLISASLSGPEWWLVMVLSKEYLTDEAHQAARIVLLFGFLLFAVSYMTVYFVVAKHLKKPLKSLQNAISLVAIGEYGVVIKSPEKLPLEEKNEIGQLAGMFLDMCHKVNDVQSNLQGLVNERTQELENANSRLRKLSLLDGLTGIHNRRSFDRDIRAVFSQGQDSAGSFFLLLIDLDWFKNFNDTHGHTAGDEALRIVAQVVASSIRKEDRVYRYGGEEIAVIINNADRDAAYQCGIRIVEEVRSANIVHRNCKYGVITISAGLVGYSDRFQNVIDMVNAADACLYEAKSSGRNCLRFDTTT